MFFRVSPEISNLIGYTVGIIFSYVMNKIFTFKGKKEFIKFTLAMLTAYILNFITLRNLPWSKCKSILFSNHFGWNFTISGYLFSINFGV